MIPHIIPNPTQKLAERKVGTLSPDAAIAETLDCYPEAGLDAIKAILSYRAAHPAITMGDQRQGTAPVRLWLPAAPVER